MLCARRPLPFVLPFPTIHALSAFELGGTGERAFAPRTLDRAPTTPTKGGSDLALPVNVLIRRRLRAKKAATEASTTDEERRT